MSSKNNNSYQKEGRALATISHLSGLFSWIFGPAVIYILSDDEFVKKNSAEALNWQIFLSLYLLVSFYVIFPGFIFILLSPFVNIAFCLVAAIRASNGQLWNYPGTVSIIGSSSNEDYSKKEPDRASNRKPDEHNREKLKKMYLSGQITEDEFESRIRNKTRDSEETKENKNNPDYTREELKNMYIEGEISDKELERKIEKLENGVQYETERSKDVNNF